jgi:hypothetical protein
MKNKGLFYILLAGGAILLLSMKKKPSYKIEVPAPEKITAEQFRQPSLLQKVSKAVKKVAPVVKKAVLTAKQKKAAQKTAAALSKGSILRGVGQFPDMC